MDASRQRAAHVPWLLAGTAITAAAVRRRVRERSSSGRGASVAQRLYGGTAQLLDHWFGWHNLPLPVGTLVLRAVRTTLRRKNLFDTSGWPEISSPKLEWDPTLAAGRSPSGSFNDLDNPAMGMSGTRFGRNVPVEHMYPEEPPQLFEPNPRKVSLELLARREFQPATSANLLAAAWLQFMVKDWFSHGKGDKDQRWEISIEPDDRWPQRPFTILKALPDSTRSKDALPPAFINTNTHWWDASQIYGSSLEEQRLRRTSTDDGKLRIGDDGLLLLPEDPELNPAMVPGWWLGLNMMATLFVREHNAVCDRLRSEYPHWSGEQVFQRARLVVSALMAKIHTTEWTALILNHPVMVKGVSTHWWGFLGERVNRAFRLSGCGELLGGFPGTKVDHYGVPFSLTEEFTIVYRMHPLIPDDYTFRSSSSDELLFPEPRDLMSLSGPAAQDFTREVPMRDIFYSFGRAHPGRIVLHNFPNTLIEFKRPKDGILVDLGAVDILRARELGVPRYNTFRRLMHMKPARTFEELTGGDRVLAEEIRRVYNGDIEQVDLIVGMFAEPCPKGFVFSDTAFRIFLLMAARRFSSDRFLADDFNETVYTPAGMEWVQSNTMISVLLRHYPQLAPALRGVDNAFKPWARVIPDSVDRQ